MPHDLDSDERESLLFVAFGFDEWTVDGWFARAETQTQAVQADPSENREESVMEPMITSEIVAAYTQCPRKAYLLLFSSDKGEPHEYVRILEQQRHENQERALDLLKQKHTRVQPYTMENLHNGSEILINARFEIDGCEAACGVLTKVKGYSTFGKYNYEPTIFVGTHGISKEQKLELFFVAHVLERLQRKPPLTGRM